MKGFHTSCDVFKQKAAVCSSGKLERWKDTAVIGSLNIGSFWYWTKLCVWKLSTSFFLFVFAIDADSLIKSSTYFKL